MSDDLSPTKTFEDHLSEYKALVDEYTGKGSCELRSGELSERVKNKAIEVGDALNDRLKVLTLEERKAFDVGGVEQNSALIDVYKLRRSNNDFSRHEERFKESRVDNEEIYALEKDIIAKGDLDPCAPGA